MANNSVDALAGEILVMRAIWAQRACQYVIAAVRIILDEQPDDIEEFVMAMGAYTFSAKKGGIYDTALFTDEDYDSDRIRMDPYGNLPDEFAPEFAVLIEELDDLTNVLGNPMRIKRGMKVVTQWGDTEEEPVVYLPLT